MRRLSLSFFVLMWTGVALAQAPASPPSSPSLGVPGAPLPPNSTPPATVVSFLDVPPSITVGLPSQMTLSVTSPLPIPLTHVLVEAPAATLVQPTTFDIPAGVTQYSRVIVIKADHSAQSGEKRVGVVLTPTGARFVTATVVAKFKVLRSLSTGAFLAIASLGVALGYTVRLFVNILKSMPAPAPAPIPPAAGQQQGRLTAWVKNHYYLVDFLVTLVVGFLVLVGLLSEGRPPDNVASWYGALTAGVALGLLTNSDLLTRIR